MICTACKKELSHYCSSCGYDALSEAGCCSIDCLNSAIIKDVKILIELIYKENPLVVNNPKILSYIQSNKQVIGELFLDYFLEQT